MTKLLLCILLTTLLSSLNTYDVNAVGSEVTYVVERDGNVADNYLVNTELNYCKIPENIRTAYQLDGGRIIVSDKNLGKYFGYGYSITGLYTYDYVNHVIWLEDRQKAIDTVIHEIGHYVDVKCEFNSSTQKFNEIYNAEVGAFANNFNTHKNNYSTPMEYFAESFYYSIINEETMKECCPLTYEHMQNIMDSF